MTRGSDDALTATAGDQDPQLSPKEPPIVTLRWVHPIENVLTVLASLEVVLGRDPSAGTRLDTPQVSRRHAAVRLVDAEHVVQDLGSKNGVFLNGERILESPLAEGDVLRLGDCVAVVETITRHGLAGFGELGQGILGGAHMREVVQIARRSAKGALNVVILGETGAGKERFAHAIHAWSERSGAFLAVNCAGYSESTAAAELFGYKRGAFTGADQASPGHVRAADGGTLLLDEILDLPLSIQAKLLRTLEQHEVLPLGETQPKSVDVRFLAASQIPLAEAVARGSFRADLCARLEGMVVKLPSLRERRADIVPLFLELLLKHGHAIRPRLDSKLVERLCLYDWPMNVRELENVARRVAAEHRGAPEVTLQQVHDLFDFGGTQKPTSEPDSARLSEPLSLAESASGSGRRSVPPYKPEEFSALEAALARQKGNLTKAAAELGMTRPKAYRMLKAKKPAK